MGAYFGIVRTLTDVVNLTSSEMSSAKECMWDLSFICQLHLLRSLIADMQYSLNAHQRLSYTEVW